MAYIDGLFSHYEYVKARIKAINPDRVVKGYMMAQDWPPKDVVEEAFYLVVLGEQPIGRQGFSPYIPIVGHEMQWVWIVKGKDIAAGQVGPNRGIKFKSHFAMMDEIKAAMSPYFCEKQAWGPSGTQPPTWVGTSLTPQEFIMWAPPRYQVKQDRDSGTVYGILDVTVWDMLDPITT